MREIKRIVDSCRLPTTVILLAVSYIDRLCAGDSPLLRPDELAPNNRIIALGRVFTVGLLFATKYMLEHDRKVHFW
jgi:hypothetical protein